MLERASGQFTIEGNVEDIFGGISGATRIARISQTCLFSGALQGESIAEYTAVLPRDADGSFQGFQRISGALGEREGTFVVRVTGEYAKGHPRGSWAIVPKSGSGDFAHIRGSGTFSQSAGKAGTYKLEFDLRKPRASRTASAAAEPDQLIPVIDIALDADAAVDVADATVPKGIEAAKPKRRPRKSAQDDAQSDTVAIAAPASVAQARPKRTRAKSAPVEPVAVAPDPTPKRSRKKAEVETTPVEPAAIVAAQPEKPAQRSRRKLAPVPVTIDPAIEPKTPQRRTRAKPAPAPEPVSTLPVETPAPKPARRTKAAPVPAPEPVPLPVAAEKPARQRKAKAA